MIPETVFSHHARSFSPAARLLSRKDRARVATLYALCRTVDDLADNIGGLEIEARLVALSANLRLEVSDDPLAIEARALFAGRPGGLASFGHLVDTVAADTGATCLDDEAALDRYCFGVAGTVGVMICELFDVRAYSHSAAVDLGKAMQLTNICRDVVADANMGRRYLPYTLCPCTPQEIAAGGKAVQKDVRSAVAQLLTHADRLYASGREGLPALPFRLRLAISVASAIYAGIGAELRARSCDPMRGRAYVSAWRKAQLAAGGVISEMPYRLSTVIRRQDVTS